MHVVLAFKLPYNGKLAPEELREKERGISANYSRKVMCRFSQGQKRSSLRNFLEMMVFLKKLFEPTIS